MTGLAQQAPALTGEPLTEAQRATFEHDGYLVLPGVLTPVAVDRYQQLVRDVYERWRGHVGNGRDMHQLSAVRTCRTLAPLCGHPRILGAVWSLLGWNVHVYHSHIDVHPPTDTASAPRFEWHQDGGRQNRELETEPRHAHVGQGRLLALGPVRPRSWEPAGGSGKPHREPDRRTRDPSVRVAGPCGRRRDHGARRRRVALRPTLVACAVVEPLLEHAEGGVLRVHVPLGPVT